MRMYAVNSVRPSMKTAWREPSTPSATATITAARYGPTGSARIAWCAEPRASGRRRSGAAPLPLHHHHRHVVHHRPAAAVGHHEIHQRVHGLAGRAAPEIHEGLFQALGAELLVGGVAGFEGAVGVGQEAVSG